MKGFDFKIVIVRNRNNPSSINHLGNYDYLTITICISISSP